MISTFIALTLFSISDTAIYGKAGIAAAEWETVLSILYEACGDNPSDSCNGPNDAVIAFHTRYSMTVVFMDVLLNDIFESPNWRIQSVYFSIEDQFRRVQDYYSGRNVTRFVIEVHQLINELHILHQKNNN